MTLEEKLDICKAWFEEKSLEIACKDTNKWEDLTKTPSLHFNFILYDYRIKEEPKQSIAYCYKMEKSGHLIWFTKLLNDKEKYNRKRCPEFDIISNKEKNNEI